MAAPWTETLLAATVTAAYLRDMLRAEHHPALDHLLESAPAAQPDEQRTYADWIVQNAPRLFLILVQLGVPQRIFAVVDQAFDDEDLPLGMADAARLGLTGPRGDSELESRFRRIQSEFTRPARSDRAAQSAGRGGAGAGQSLKLSIEVIESASDVTDLVSFRGNRSKVFTRRCVPLAHYTSQDRQNEFVRDVKAIKKLNHQHIVSIRTAYSTASHGFILLHPVVALSLKDFPMTGTKLFHSLPGESRTTTVLNWPYCLANALLFLHDQGSSHGKIVPSNIFVDPINRIYLGFSVTTPTIQCPEKESGHEAYNYSAPERWTSFSSSSFRQSSRKSPLGRTRRFFGKASSKSNTTSSKSSSTRRTERTSISPNDTSLTLDNLTISPPFSPEPGGGSPQDASRRASIAPSLASSFDTGGAPSTYDGDWDAVESSRRASDAPAVDPRCGDIFSLACIILDILGFLLHGRQVTFAPQREKRFSSSDGSFHANPEAVEVHMEALRQAAVARMPNVQSLKMEKQEQYVTATFGAVGPMLELQRRMLNDDPSERPTAIDAVTSMEAILGSVNIAYLHCGGGIW